MSSYSKSTDFAAKDSLPSGNANKVVSGTEINTEFNAIETAVNSKANTASPTFTGIVSAGTVNIDRPPGHRRCHGLHSPRDWDP